MLLNSNFPHIRLRAFRAINEPTTCERFIEGHTNVLTSIGVTKVTSSKNEWQYNPAAFVIVVESFDGSQIFGGARVHVAGGTQPLPIEEATGTMDQQIFQLVWQQAHFGTGEICGLWNSPDLAGYGIGSPLLIRAGIALANQIGLQSLFALCAPYTVKPVVHAGMVLIEEVGNRGTFYYPKLDLIATCMILNDVCNLSLAHPEDKSAIMLMRDVDQRLQIERLKDKDILIDFDLKIPYLDQWSLPDTIALAKERKMVDHSNVGRLSMF